MTIPPLYSSDQSNMSAYLAEIKGFARLTREQEMLLSKRIQEVGDKDAEERLIQANLRLVVYIAKKFKSRAMTLDDLIQSGNYGLVRAAREYDASAYPDTPFAVFASRLIKQAISKDLDDSDLVSIPDNVYVARKLVWKATDRFLAENDREPTEQEMMALMGLTARQLGSVRLAQYAIRSLDQPVSDEEDLTGADLLADPSVDVEAEVIDPMEQEEDAAKLTALVEEICTPREKLVLALRYGLGSLEGKTYLLEQIATQLGLARESIRQTELQALAKLRRAYECGRQPTGIRQAMLFAA